ncbi:hypothetical protein Tco_1427456 [Tanacetum coccineum]
MNKKNYSFDLEMFRDMLQICPNLPRQKFVDPPFEEEILAFIRELSYSGNVKSLSDIKVDTLAQPWRTFGTIIKKCLSGKVTGLDLLRLSRAQILWDQSIPRRNKVDWHMASNDPILTTIRFIPQHEVVQKYGAILPDTLTNQTMKESEAYKTYYDLATGKVAPKPKYQPVRGLETLSEIARSKAEQMKIVIERSKTQLYSSHASSSGADEGTGVSPGVPDVPTDGSEDEQISWKFSDEDDDEEVSISKDDDEDADDQDDDDQEYNGQDDKGQDDVNEQTESDNDGDDFVHPKFSTHNQEETQDEEDKQEEGSDLRVQTPSHYESTDDEESDEVTQGANVEGEEMDEEETNEEEEVFELYRDVNVNLEGRDTEMTDAPQTNVQGNHVTEDTYVIIIDATPEVQQQSSSVISGFISNMFNPNPDTSIDSILNLNTESTTLVDVPITSNVEMPPSSATTPLPPLIPLIQPLQQTPVPTPTIVPSTSLQDLPNVGSLFKFEDRVKALEDDFSEFKQTNQFATAVSSIPGIFDTYLANKMNEAVKTVVQLQSDRLRDEAQAENADFINKLDDNIKKIIKEQTSHAIAANLFELELKKILIDKMESNKSIHRSDQHKTLYKALVDAYESEKLILDTYGDTVMIKRYRDDQDEDEEQSGGSNRGSKRRRAGKEPELTSEPKEKTSKSSGKSKEGSKYHNSSTGKSAQAEEPIHANKDLEEHAHQDNLAQKEDTRDSFNMLMDNPLDFSAFVMNRLKVDTLTPELLAGPTFELMKGSCKSQQYTHDLRKPLHLIPNSQGRRVIPFDHFINNDLAYLWGGSSSRTYATSITKTKAADYGHIKWIEDLVPNTIWSPMPVINDKHALWGISHWGQKCQQFYGFAVNRESARDVYSRHRIIAVTKLQIVEWHNYKHLDWITVRRNDDKLYTFKEGDYKRLRLQDIEDMLLLLVQGKLTNLTIEERLALNVSLRMFTRSIVIQRRVEDLQLGVKSYQKKLNLTRPDTYRSDLKRLPTYSAYPNPRGFIYQNKDKKNKLMRIDELHKFSDGTLNDVRTALDDILKRIRMKYLPQTYWKKVDKDRAGAMIQAIDKMLKNRRIMRSLEKFVGGRPYEGDFRRTKETFGWCQWIVMKYDIVKKSTYPLYTINGRVIVIYC